MVEFIRKDTYKREYELYKDLENIFGVGGIIDEIERHTWGITSPNGADPHKCYKCAHLDGEPIDHYAQRTDWITVLDNRLLDIKKRIKFRKSYVSDIPKIL